MKKRFSLIFAVFAMMFACCLFASAQENETVVIDNVVYQLVAATEQEAEHYEVISFFDSVKTKKTKTEITIPSEINGIPVTSIAYNNSYSNGYSKSVVEKITLPDTIETIGTKAFVYMRNLKEINIPSCVTTIGGTAFANCSSLTQITIPESVGEINRFCFMNCINLKQVSILGNGLKEIRGWSFQECTNLESIDLPSSLEKICDGAFYRAGLKGTLRIPGKCSVEYRAFQYNNNLTKVIFENREDDTYNFISFAAFANCKNLKEVYLPKESVGFKIGTRAFFSCTNLEAVYNTDNVKSINEGAFAGCVNLEIFNMPSSLERVGEDAFSRAGLKGTLRIPGKCVIEHAAFKSNNNLTKVVFENREDENDVFIFSAAFYSCKNLKEVYLPKESVRFEIPHMAFRNCQNLSAVYNTDNVKSIDYNAFTDCVNLESIDLPSFLEEIDSHAFSRAGLKGTLRIPGKCEIGLAAFKSNTNLTKVVFENREDENENFIGKGAFKGCTNLEKVYLPKESVGFEIRDNAFKGCTNLVAVYRTDHVKSIGYHAFYNCESLTSFTVPEEIESIQKYAFSGCSSLKNLCVLTTNNEFLTTAMNNADFNFLRKIPDDCKIYVKDEAMCQAFIDAGCTNKVIIKSDLK